MSLWTPDGEHSVPRENPSSPDPDDDGLAGLDPEQREQARAMAADMDEVRRQVAEVPASLVVANHAMGLYELAAIHLSQEPPRFEEARLAIDGLGLLVEGLEGRLGENEQTLREALGQLRLAFVQLHGLPSDQATEGAAPASAGAGLPPEVDEDDDDEDDEE
jgi:hypothetical protein